MFIIFDTISGEPLIVTLIVKAAESRDLKSRILTTRAIIVCASKENAKKMLRKIFGNDEK